MRFLAIATIAAVGLTACAAVATAAREPTHAEREAITHALPAVIRNTPVDCLSLQIRISRNPRFAHVRTDYLNWEKPGSRCLRYATNGFLILRKTVNWKVIFIGSDFPSCSMKIPRDLGPCQP